MITDASGTFNPITRDAAWDRMSQADAQLMSWFVRHVNYTATGVMTLKTSVHYLQRIFQTIKT